MTRISVTLFVKEHLMGSDFRHYTDGIDQNKDFEKLLDESVQDGREQKVEDITVCRSCHGQRYYRII